MKKKMEESNSISILWWIIGIAVALFAAFKLFRIGGVSKEKAGEAFRKNRKRFDALINDLGNSKFDKQAWSEEFVDLNDSSLLKYWISLCKSKTDSDLMKSWYNILSNDWNIYIPKHQEDGKPIAISAKQAFISRLTDFTNILYTLTDSTCDKNKAIKLWTDAVVNVNNKNLSDLWAKMVKKYGIEVFDKWKRQLEAWGVKSDSCTTFTYTERRTSGYTLQGGTTLEDGNKYNVISPCWVLTVDMPDGGVQKTIIKNGVVEPK